jgi:hypothetical protein
VYPDIGVGVGVAIRAAPVEEPEDPEDPDEPAGPATTAGPCRAGAGVGVGVAFAAAPTPAPDMRAVEATEAIPSANARTKLRRRGTVDKADRARAHKAADRAADRELIFKELQLSAP